MVAKVLAGVGLFLALVAIILKSVALSVPHFVDVHLVNDPNDASDENRLGGVGVFQSEFDSDLEGDILDDITAANVPIITITTPTLEFPLLFPSQENFFATVLPIDRATIAELDTVVVGAEDAIGDEIDAVAALELNGDDCTTFTVELGTSVTAFFTALQDEVIPLAVNTIAALIPGLTFQTLSVGLEGIPDAFVAVETTFAAGVFSDSDLVAFLEASESCENITVSSDLVIDSTTRECLFNLFDTAAPASAFIGFIAELINSEVACPDADALTVFSCISENSDKYVVDDTSIFDVITAATFANNDAPFVCDGVLLTCNSKLEFLQEVVSVFGPFTDNDDLVDLVSAVGAYLFFVSEGFVDNEGAGTFAVGFDDWPTTDINQTKFNATATGSQEYEEPCDVINPLVSGACTSLETFLSLLPVVLEGNALQPTVASISGIYATFFETGLTLDLAPGAFAVALIAAGFNTDFENEQDPFAEIIQNCADDVEDNEKIAQAQALSIASALFEALSLLLIIAGIILPVEKLAYLAPAAAISGVLGGAFIIGALLVTQSAPVYEGVGDTEVDESGDAEIFFIQGYVPLLALVDAVLFFLSGVVLIAATVFACKESGDSELVDDDVKEDLAMEDKI